MLELSNPETSHCVASHIRKSILLHNSHYITSAKGTALEKTEQEGAGVLLIGASHQSITSSCCSVAAIGKSSVQQGR